MKVVGLDVCKNSVVACTLDSHRPIEPRQFYYDATFKRYFADALGIKSLLELQPDVAVMEPTGVNYSKLWAAKLAAGGVQVVLVGHKQLRSYRINLGLPDKDDEADALALACYYIEHEKSPSRFVRTRDPVVAQMRDLVLRLAHLNRIQSPVINRLRQDLAWQFPEVAAKDLKAVLFWGWLAGRRRSQRYDRALASSIGLGLQCETRQAASMIVELATREAVIARRLRDLLKDIRFTRYRQVFARFGFGERTEALVLSQIYPLSNYLGPDGKPEVKIRTGKVSGAPTKRHLSRRRFQKALGVAPQREHSGDMKKSRKAGSSLCRSALWQWLYARIEPERSRVRSDIGNALHSMLILEKSIKPVKLARSRVCSKAAALLFRELVKELA